MKNLFSLLFLLAWSSYALAKTTLPALANTPLPKIQGYLNNYCKGLGTSDQGDTSNWVQQIFAPQCGSISEKNIEVLFPELFSATFKCFENGYSQYQWRYRAKEGNPEWIYVEESSPIIFGVTKLLYELQVRGMCVSNNEWSEWSESKSFVPRKCGLPDSIELVPAPRTSTTVGILIQSNNVPWRIDQFKWYYRFFGQKDWLDSVYTKEKFLLLHNLLPGTRYEVLLEMICDESLPNKMTVAGEFTSPADCIVPTTQSIKVQKLTQQSMEITLDVGHIVEYEVRYRVKGSLGAYDSLQSRYGEPVLLTQLSPQIDYEIMLRVICQQGAPWSEAIYIRTKACDIPYDGRIVLSTISEDSVKAYVELYDFNPAVTGVSYTWRFKPLKDGPWQQVFVDASNALTIKNLRAGEFYDLQAVLKCKNNVQDSISFITHFEATTDECSTTPDLALVDQVFYGGVYGIGIKCNLPFRYKMIVRTWSINRQNGTIGDVNYSQLVSCDYPNVIVGLNDQVLVKFQFRLICPNGNIGPWSEVITLDQRQRARELDPTLLIPRTSTPASALTIKLWPNPNTGQFQVQFAAGLEGESLLSVFSADGRKVMTQKVQVYDQMPVEFDLSGQTPGLYFVRVQIGKNTFTERILLQKH